MSEDETGPRMERLEQYAGHLGVVIRLDPQQSGLMILIKDDANQTFDRMIVQYIEHVMGLRLLEPIAATCSGWRQLGVILNGPTTTRQQVFGELTWRPEGAQQNACTGRVLLLGSVALVVGLFAACTPDYVYIRDGQSEAAVRQDYVNCAEQQVKVSNSTTECMEKKGYQAVIIEEPYPESPPHLFGSPQVSR